MQFKGTPQFPATVLDKAISRAGGLWNAFTYLDWTTYFETMPAGEIDLALRLESDRMVNSMFEENEVSFEMAELGYLGVNHCVIGAKLADLWNFPALLINTIQNHH